MKLVEGSQYELIGTGFFITSSGVFATAKHVLLSAHNGGYPIFTWQFIAPNQWLIRPVLQFSFHEDADVAIGVCSPARHEETGALLSDTRVRLTTSVHSIGDLVTTYAYPNTIIESSSPGQILSFDPNFFEGSIRECLPNGRDLIMLRGPCYRTDMVIHHGASGGPVADSSGRVFAINSTGFDGTDDSYISRIDELFPLKIVINDNERTAIQELIQHGAVTVDS